MPLKKPVNQEVVMIDTSAGNTVRYLWDFGDGSPPVDTADRIARHTYTKPGTYTVIHSVFDSCGSEKICADIAEISAAAGGGVPVFALGLLGLFVVGMVSYGAYGGKK